MIHGRRLRLGGVQAIGLDVAGDVGRRLDSTVLHLLETLANLLTQPEIESADVARLAGACSTMLAEWRLERGDAPVDDAAPSDIDAELAELLRRGGVVVPPSSNGSH